MDFASKNVEPPEPPRELISSDRVRFLTSWKLWAPMLFLALLLIAASILWPAYRRMRALELIRARDGTYNLGDVRWKWMAEHMGPLGVAYYSVEAIYLNEPISLAEFQSLQVLSEVETLRLDSTSKTPERIDALRGFPNLQWLAAGEVTADQIHQVLECVPTLSELNVRRVTEGEQVSFDDLSQGGRQLKSLYIANDCRPSFTIAGFPLLEWIHINSMEDAELILRDLPMLESVRFWHVNERTRLTHDFMLPFLSYESAVAQRIVVPSLVRELYIGNGKGSTITGGAYLTQLKIFEGDDVTIENSPVLSRLECTSSIGGTLTLNNLPQLEHFILMSVEGYSRPNVVLDGVDNLRAIDAPWWRPNWTTGDPALLQIVELPRLEHLVIPRATLTPEYLPLLQQMETLRFLRLPRQLLSVSAEGRNEWQETDFNQLRRDFPQPSIRIHGPPRINEQDDRWTPSP